MAITTVAVVAIAADLTHLPLGDGHISTSPQKGWIWACHIDSHAGGAQELGPWVHGDIYDLTSKVNVQGSVPWQPRFSMSVAGNKRVITTNALPNHPTGVYPVAENDPAHNIDGNPNSIRAQTIDLKLPLNPTLAAQPTCAPGAVGVLLSGVPLFNALDGPGRDAVAHEVQDSCQGHPGPGGTYHYHSLSSCVPDHRDATGHSALMGYSLDGFGIYGHYGENGKLLSSADLDECHGHTHMIEWDGKRVNMYHYHATYDFPYTVGCMRGTYSNADVRTISGGGGGGGMPPNMQAGMPGMRHPPDLGAAAQRLGIFEEQLHDALGPPPPDIDAAAARLGISADQLRAALGHPPQ